MTGAMFVDCIPIQKKTFISLKKQGVNVDKLYDIFISDELTTKEKRTYLYYGLKVRLKRTLLDRIWNAYMGDNNNKYADIPDIDYKYYVEGD